MSIIFLVMPKFCICIYFDWVLLIEEGYIYMVKKIAFQYILLEK